MAQQALMRAAVDGDVDAASVLLRSGADPAWGNPMGQTALHIAALWGRREVCKVLIKGKANVNQQNKRGATPLHSAASGRGEPEGRAEAIEVLLQAGARRDAQNQAGQTPIVLAEEEEVRIALGGQELHIHNATQSRHLKALGEAIRKHENSINDVNGKGETALYLAVSSSWNDGASCLLVSKADPNIAPYRTNAAPLSIAVQNGNVVIVKELLAAQAEMNAQDRDMEADPRFASSTFKATPDEHCSALHYASSTGNAGIATLLVQRKACVNITDSHQCSPLHHCLEQMLEQDPDMEVGSGVRLQDLQAKPVWNGQIASVFGEMNKDGRWPVHVCSSGEEALIKTKNLTGPLFEETLSILLEAKADACTGNHRMGMERSFLHTAAMSGSAKLIGQAISAGCPVDAMFKGSTPLHLLARKHCDLEAFRVLVEAKADLNIKSNQGESTPLDIALKNRAPAEIIRLLGGDILNGTSKSSNASGYPSQNTSDSVQSISDLSAEMRAQLFLG